MAPLSFILIAFEVVLAAAYFFWVQARFAPLTFATPWLLLLLVPVAIVGAWAVIGRRSPRFGFSYAGALGDLPQSVAELVRPAVVTLASIGLGFLVIAAARPQSESGAGTDATEGIDIVVALDVSGSMEAADFKPSNRLFVAKQVLSEFVQQRRSDRLGLVVFAGEAYTQVPLTLDYDVLVNLLDEIKTGVIKDGTAIGDALGTAVNRLRDQPSKTKIILLLTDGDSNAGSLPPLEAAGIAADLDIRIYTILIGKDGPVPFPQGKDLFGNIVYGEAKIPINPELLKQIAEKTKATSHRAEDGDSLRRGLHQALDHLEKSKFEETSTAPKEELFGRFLWVGVVLLALERLLRLTRFQEALA